jgi:hypothetical protein
MNGSATLDDLRRVGLQSPVPALSIRTTDDEDYGTQGIQLAGMYL